MERLLRSRGLWTQGVQQELAAGRFYWREERRLCALMLARPTVPDGGHGAACGFTEAEVLAASAAKSFDYRLLHHLLCALCGAPADPGLLDFLRVDELLVDAGDDLTDVSSWAGLRRGCHQSQQHLACAGSAAWRACRALP